MNKHHQNAPFTVTIQPSGRTIPASSGVPLLTLFAEHSILLRSDCGGKGLCGKCQVEVDDGREPARTIPACSYMVETDCVVTIPTRALMSPHIIDKAAVQLPASFAEHLVAADKPAGQWGVAVDLGTTTVAVYLLDTRKGEVLATMAVKNPQSLYGDDVMSRISYIGRDEERLSRLQNLVTGTIDWAVESLLASRKGEHQTLTEMVVVGNPAMIHIFLGVLPNSIGISPYIPQFLTARTTPTKSLGMSLGDDVKVRTLPQISGFIGGDILAASVAVELAEQPVGTLLIDLGTNGELMLKGADGFYATSCATGPAFEGATLSSGIQAVPGAIDRISVGSDHKPVFTMINNGKKTVEKPLGICGSGIISGVAAFVENGVVEKSGAFAPADEGGPIVSGPEGKRYRLYADDTGDEVTISQKDIRNVQLGKAALISGIEFLLAAAKMDAPEQIIVAGAFGSHLDKRDLLAIGMLPQVDPDTIHIAGNAAGSGAIMALCDDSYLHYAQRLAAETTVINLAEDMAFQRHFVDRLSF
ncbi:MAG: ASKHA domain-containing protein [Desulfopila sp.]